MQHEEIKRYMTVDDSGKSYVVVEYQNIIAATFSGRTQRTKGTKFHHTSDGQSVNWISDGVFEIVQNDKRLTVVS